MENSMDRFEELKQKYASALTVVQQQGVRVDHLQLQDNKLFTQGAAPSEAIKNALWDRIKAINPNYDDVTVHITVDPSRPQPVPARTAMQIYTVQPGDSLYRKSRSTPTEMQTSTCGPSKPTKAS